MAVECNTFSICGTGSLSWTACWSRGLSQLTGLHLVPEAKPKKREKQEERPNRSTVMSQRGSQSMQMKAAGKVRQSFLPAACPYMSKVIDVNTSGSTREYGGLSNFINPRGGGWRVWMCTVWCMIIKSEHGRFIPQSVTLFNRSHREWLRPHAGHNCGKWKTHHSTNLVIVRSTVLRGCVRVCHPRAHSASSDTCARGVQTGVVMSGLESDRREMVWFGEGRRFVMLYAKMICEWWLCILWWGSETTYSAAC